MVLGKIKTLLCHYDIWLIMSLAFIVRIIGYQWMDYTNFPEFYRDYYMVSHIAHGMNVLLGPPSMLHGFHFGPFYYYSMVPFFILFNGHPFSLIFTGILFSVLSVYAFYKILLLWFDNLNVARVGALFVAVSVYSLHLVSYVSNPNFLPLFVLWYFYYLTKILQGNNKTKDYLLLGLSFGLATQLHATAMIVLPLVTVTALLVHKYKFHIKSFLYFLAAGIFSYAPYLYFELTHSFVDFKRLFILGSKELDGSHYTSGIAAIWNFFQGTMTPFNNWYSYTWIQPNSLFIIVAICAVICIAELLFKLLKKEPAQTDICNISKPGLTIILAWTFFVCTTLLLFARGVHDHYIIILWPVPIIALAYGISWMKSRFNVFASLIVLIVVTSLLQIYSFYNVEHTSWSTFVPIYQAQYQNSPVSAISEIGS